MTRNKKGQFATKAKWTLRIIGLVIIGSAIGTAVFSTSSVSATVPEVITVEAKTPIMDRIAKCESDNSQTKNGQTLIHINSNGTYDQGRFQINSIHNAEASKLGFNLATEEGNTAYAKWLYANKGTGDWASSQGCWKK